MSPPKRGTTRGSNTPGRSQTIAASTPADKDDLTRQTRQLCYVESALENEHANVEQAPIGHRNATLANSARSLAQLVAGGVLSEDRVVEMLFDAGRAAGLSDGEIHKAKRWGFRIGSQQPRSVPTKGPLRDHYQGTLAWFHLWESLDQADFPGTRGSSELRVIAAFVLAGTACHRLELSLSFRQIAERSGLASSTVTPLLKRGGKISRYVRATHRARPHLWQQPKEGEPRSTVWCPVPQRKDAIPAQQGVVPVPKPPACADSVRLVDPAANRWVGQSNAWRIAGLLNEETEMTVKDLAETTALHPVTVRRVLTRLAETGHARKVERGTWIGVTPPADTPDVARDGVDHLARRRAAFEKQRADFQEAIERRRRADSQEAAERSREIAATTKPVTPKTRTNAKPVVNRERPTSGRCRFGERRAA